MNGLKFTFRSLLHHRQSNFWIIMGSALCTAILLGALVVGDSVRGSLTQHVYNRLGSARFGLVSGNRLFHADLADTLSFSLGTTVTPLYRVPGIAVGEGQRLDRIQVVGVDQSFDILANIENLYGSLASDEVIVNDQLANSLGLRQGDSFLLRVEKTSAMPKGAPLSSADISTVASRVRVKHLVGADEFGHFDLANNQLVPGTVFLPINRLGEITESQGRANVLLVSDSQKQGSTKGLTEVKLNERLQELWRLKDAGLRLRRTSASSEGFELISERIFLDEAVVSAAKEIDADSKSILTYFVNEFRKDKRSTPYSFISAAEDSWFFSSLQKEKIIINQWLADDLSASAGDSVTLSYYVFDEFRQLSEKTTEFTVERVVPALGRYADKNLMPDLPGLAGEENCRDWEAGFPIDYDKIRPKDEQYWDDFRGTPKAFISLDDAERLWENRYGKSTAVRFADKDSIAIEKALLERLQPARIGYSFRDLRTEGLSATQASVDFGQLFLGLSFFVILAAVLLTGLLFLFHIEQRDDETGLLMALGFPNKSIRFLYLKEGAVLVFLGGILGIPFGLIFNQMILKALTTMWSDAVGMQTLSMFIKPTTILTGFLSGVLVVLLAILIVLQNRFKKSAQSLQRKQIILSSFGRSRRKSAVFFLLCFILAALPVLLVLSGSVEMSPGLFFLAGFLFLLGGIGFCDWLLRSLVYMRSSKKISNTTQMGVRSLVRRPRQSLVLTGLLASSLFIVFTVGANRKQVEKNVSDPASGTGGFTFVGESVVPLFFNMNTKEGLSEYGLEELDSINVSFLQFYLRDGDDASCLNLNQVSNPQLLGVKPDLLAKRQAFTFVKQIEYTQTQNAWELLNQRLGQDVIPGIADQTVITWGLGKQIGDTLFYVDENGKSFGIKLVAGLANSIYQGHIIVSEKNLLQRYPSISGSSFFLVDAPEDFYQTVKEKLMWALQDQGLKLSDAAEKLANFNRVENTYLSIFLLLGALGVLLGSIGVAVVLMRNIAERRGETALLRALGFSDFQIRSVLFTEHMIAVLSGALLGLLASLCAMIPVLLSPGADIPVFLIITLFFIILAHSAVWILIGASRGNQKFVIPDLRNE